MVPYHALLHNQAVKFEYFCMWEIWPNYGSWMQD